MLLLSNPHASNKNEGGKKPLRVIEDLTCLTRIDGRDETRADSVAGFWALGWQGLGVRIQTLGEVFWEPLHVSARVPSQAVGRVMCGLRTADRPC